MDVVLYVFYNGTTSCAILNFRVIKLIQRLTTSDKNKRERQEWIILFNIRAHLEAKLESIVGKVMFVCCDWVIHHSATESLRRKANICYRGCDQGWATKIFYLNIFWYDSTE